MNRNFRKWDSILAGPAIAFTFLLLMTCPQSTLAQTNTFPSTGNAGVGTTTPAVPLDLKGNNVSFGGQLRLQGPDYAQITFYNQNNPTLSSANRLGSIFYDMNSTSLFVDANMGNKRLLLQAAGGGGNVGIGLTNPLSKLHVAGSITVDGNINAKYQDVAEWVPATSVLAVGTVVTLDPTRSNHVEASSQAYDTRVAGVISGQPGIALGERGDSKVLVATTGRVKLTVDASTGSIHIGDLLVTSDIPGVAMRSNPINVGGAKIHRPGTIVGKALESLAKGRGEILVLLSLQ